MGKQIIALLLIPLLGCGINVGISGSEEQSRDAEVSVVLEANAPQEYRSVTWIDEWLVVQIDASESIYGDRLWRVHPDGSEMEMLNLPNIECEYDALTSPARLPDDRLQYLSDCPPRPSWESGSYLVAYDLSSEHAVPLLSYPVNYPGTGGMVQPWNPDMTKGISSQGIPHLDEDLFWFTTQGKEDIVLPNLKDAFGATWSPDGRYIAFVAAKEPSSPTGFMPPYHFYLIDLAQETNLTQPSVQKLIASPVDTVNAVWSSDSEWLLFAGELSGKEGIWLIRFSDRELILVTEGNFRSPAWSPDGQQLVAIHELGDVTNSQTEVVTIDLAEIVKKK